MWLKFGVSRSGELVSVDEVGRGKTRLSCLYCGGPLTARKGTVKEHHFAHSGQTCQPVVQRIKTKAFPSLPLYDNFLIQLKGEELERLKVLWRQYGLQQRPIPKDLIEFRWVLKGLMQTERNFSQFTNLGRIPVGALPLGRFNQVQEPRLLEELDKLERSANVAIAAGLSNAEERRADLEIYRVQFRRILLNSLYFLEVRASGQLFHKVGITTRPIEQRIKEVERDMRSHFVQVEVNLLGLWQHRGNVELYFKHRYQRFNFLIGSLTEYFLFPNVDKVLQDLNKMEIKVLSEIENSLLLDKI
ncbi:GIY-YIG nuclease family protein [Laspinema olomoucense]|uniref:GIY-YIG nuclease family protein n=1 Tax=Laspinema olomoucense TaxID=3231600 RepID=UPI0021BB3E68|nr:GIY-YIG nuclease family protein [Laspinema sp. D3d]MCT7971114.1 GIY-YIG nuclease family protein [Laspinema sp. D3d]